MGVRTDSSVVARGEHWQRWQAGVVVVLREELQESLPDINASDIDWVSWRRLYERGTSPRMAVLRALELD